MKIITLPEALCLETSLEVSVFNYQSDQEISKQQIILNRNTFSFLQEGYKEVIFNTSSFSIDSSQFLLMKSSHCLMTEKLSNLNSSYGSILLFFSNQSVLNFIRKFKLPPLKTASSSSVFSFPYDAFIQDFVHSLTKIIELPELVQEQMLQVKFEEIMLYLSERKGPGFLYALMEKNDEQVEKFIQTVESNKLNKLTLAELSFLCNRSISSFKRAFEKYYGTSPIKWFQDQRLIHASELIKQGKRPSDIYLEVGYENLSSFVQAYKLKFGITPKQHQEV